MSQCSINNSNFLVKLNNKKLQFYYHFWNVEENFINRSFADLISSKGQKYSLYVQYILLEDFLVLSYC